MSFGNRARPPEEGGDHGQACRACFAGRVEQGGAPAFRASRAGRRWAAAGSGAGRAGGDVSGGRRRAQRAPGQLAAPRQGGER